MISSEYTGEAGLYARVIPREQIPGFVILNDTYEFKAVPPEDYHATVVYSPDARVPRETLEGIVDLRSLSEATQFDSYSVNCLQYWAAEGRLYVGIEFYSPDLFILREILQKYGKFTSTYDIYKCHLTLGSFRGIPEEILNNKTAMESLGKSSIALTSAIPPLVHFSNLGFENVRQ